MTVTPPIQVGGFIENCELSIRCPLARRTQRAGDRRSSISLQHTEHSQQVIVNSDLAFAPNERKWFVSGMSAFLGHHRSPIAFARDKA